MKHLLRFLLIFVLIVLTLVITLCLNISFDSTPAVAVHYCSAHGLLSIDVTLPSALLRAANIASAATDALPDVLTEPPRILFHEIGEVIRAMREAYAKETAGCTAFS